MRRGLTWLLVLPAIVLGSQVAHDVAYWWAYPHASLRLEVLSDSGHGYLAFAPAVLAFLAAVELVVFPLVVLDRVRGRPARSAPAWAFLLIPELGFVFQEHLERLVATGAFPWWAWQEPSFWRGLLLQVPLGLAAYLIARLLLGTAAAVADVLAARRHGRAVLRVRIVIGRPPAPVFLPRRAPLAGRAADRAPPLLAL